MERNRGFSIEEFANGTPEARGERDRRLLEELLSSNADELHASEHEAFAGMLERLVDETRVELSERQRAWVEGTAQRIGVDLLTPEERNRNVPRGREVQVPDVLSRENLERALRARRRR